MDYCLYVVSWSLKPSWRKLWFIEAENWGVRVGGWQQRVDLDRLLYPRMGCLRTGVAWRWLETVVAETKFGHRIEVICENGGGRSRECNGHLLVRHHQHVLLDTFITKPAAGLDTSPLETSRRVSDSSRERLTATAQPSSPSRFTANPRHVKSKRCVRQGCRVCDISPRAVVLV